MIADEADPDSSNDFGKNIIPKMLKDNKRLFSYEFSGYWKDVGTIQAYWESNMDLVKRIPDFNLFDQSWKIFTVNPVMPANYIGPEGIAKRSIIAEGCMIYGTVINSVISPGVQIAPGSVVEDSIIMANTTIGANTKIKKAIISENVTVGNDVEIGYGEDIVNICKPDLYNSGLQLLQIVRPYRMHVKSVKCRY